MKNFNLHKPDINSGYAEKQPRSLASRLHEARDLAASRKLENSIFRGQASGHKQNAQVDSFSDKPSRSENS